MRTNSNTPASAGASSIQHTTQIVKLTAVMSEGELKKMLPRLFRRGLLPRVGEIDVLEVSISVTRGAAHGAQEGGRR